MKIKEIAKKVVGLKLSEAKQLTEENNISSRVVKENGISAMITVDYSSNRINFIVINGIVTNATIG